MASQRLRLLEASFLSDSFLGQRCKLQPRLDTIIVNSQWGSSAIEVRSIRFASIAGIDDTDLALSDPTAADPRSLCRARAEYAVHRPDHVLHLLVCAIVLALCGVDVDAMAHFEDLPFVKKARTVGVHNDSYCLGVDTKVFR